MENDRKSFGFATLGFIFPIVGLVLYIVWKPTLPLKARSAGLGALISTVLGILFYILVIPIMMISSGAVY